MSDSRKSRTIPLIITGLAGIALMVTLIATRGDEPDSTASDPTSETGPESDDSLSKSAGQEPDDPMAMGEVDAPVVMVTYADFQCSYCAEFALNTLPALEKRYVEDGTLRVEWRDFPFLGPDSKTAALAGRAAAEQGMFWEFHDALYAAQSNGGRLDRSFVVSIAKDLGLDLKKFRSYMSSPEAAREMKADIAKGEQFGITGTPSFDINGVKVVGSEPIGAFKRIIEKAAAKASTD